MRHVIVCDAHNEPAALAELSRSGVVSSDRIIVLSSRRGNPVENGGVLNIPLKWALNDAGSRHWQYEHMVRKATTLAAGIRSSQLFGGINDLLINIDASDPDVIDLRYLGGFGRGLGRKCALRFPGRKVLTYPEAYARDEATARWRTYDPSALVSIVLPVYNGARYLGFSIESCLKQTHRNLELIIVDDCSTDETPAIISKYADLDWRLKHVRNERNLGLPESLNVGFGIALGQFLTWTSDDNLYAPTAIEYMVQQLCTFSKVGLVYCASHIIDEAGRMLELRYTMPPTAFIRENVVGGCFMYRREVMEAVGQYRPIYRYAEDFDFWIRACLRFPAKFSLEPLYFYRHHGASLTSSHRKKWKLLKARLLLEHFGSGRNQIKLPGADQAIPEAPRGPFGSSGS